jgi:REP element-mobilizing transposase RayT
VTRIDSSATKASHTNLTVHVVVATLRRKALIDARLAAGLYPFIEGVIRGDRGRLIEIGGTRDHIHLLARIDPALAVADMVHRVKSKSARWVNEFLKPPERFAWQRGYAAFSVSRSRVAQAAAYIAGQAAQHAAMTFDEELALLLAKHGMDAPVEGNAREMDRDQGRR